MDDPKEKLMIELIHFLSEQFPNQAILKGGMVLRLLDCPRFTNDLDYIFVPFESKNDVNSLILNALNKLTGISYQSSINSTCIRYLLCRDDTQIQLEVNVSDTCKSEPLSTSTFAQKNGYFPRIIRVMDYRVALSHKIAAWNERGLIRDLYDISFFTVVLSIVPDLEILKNRLKSVKYRNKNAYRKKEMTIGELSVKLELVADQLTQLAIEEELRDYFSSNELAGVDKRIKTGLYKLIDCFKKVNDT